MHARKRRKRRIQKIRRIGRRFYYIYLYDKRYHLVLCSLLLFVVFGSVYCVKADRAREEQERIQIALENEKKAEQERKQEEAAREKAEAERKKENSLQSGIPVGRYEQTDDKIVYMTFDDGPSDNTKEVLDILDEYHAKATFFVTGHNQACNNYIKEAYDAGHTIGLHTYTHDYSQIYASDEAYFEDLEKVGNMVKEEIGYVPCYIRFPGGASNTISSSYCSGIMSRLTEAVMEKGYQYYDWNCSSGDGDTMTAEEVYQQSIGSEMNEVLLLFHDSEPKDSTVEALPKIIEHYKVRGYEFKAISRESYVVHHGTSN